MLSRGRRRFRRRWVFVYSPLTALDRIEIFAHVGDIYLVARDSGGEQSLVEQFSSRSDERMTSQVFLITRLFADEHNLDTRVPFAEYSLRRATPNVTCAAAFSGLRECFYRIAEGYRGLA